ncbi:rhomboid-like protein [Nocardia terrae]|uniref:rhomboid-like protein n=1 Tax=Nocardia terrae TaxID=2675851 RepID=UPI0018E00DD6|nr:rhomboid-like protein [Nocardia terrae]
MGLGTYQPPWLRTVDPLAEMRAFRVWWEDEPHPLRRAVQAYRDLLAVTPACIAYAFTLFITWWTLRGASDIVGRRLIFSASTNLRNMQKDPIQVLVASAFWTDGGFPWGDILILVTLMALAERWLGSLRWILVVAIGHVGATLITVLGISHKIDKHLIPTRVAFASDVGPSYGISAMLAALTFRLRGPARWLWALGVLSWYAYGVYHGRTFTDYGHFFALLIGFTVGAIALALAHRLVAVRERKAAAHSAAAVAHSAEAVPDSAGAVPDSAGAVPDSARHGVGTPTVALDEPDGGLDDARRDRAEHGHH